MKTPEPLPLSSRWFTNRSGTLVLMSALAALLVGCGDSKTEDAQSPPQSRGPSAATSAATAPVPGGTPIATAKPAGPADEAWEAFQRAFDTPPSPPESWTTQPPSEDAMRTFQRSRGEAAEKTAALAADFYTRFPSDPRAQPARWRELQLLDVASKLGQTNVIARLAKLETERLSDPATTEDERFSIRMTAAQRSAGLLMPQGEQAVRAALEASARQLTNDFPSRPEPYQVLLNLAGEAPPEKARSTAESLLALHVPEPIRDSARALLTTLERVGKRLDLKFTAVDGRDVDLAAMRGKVVLVDFWATWCGPCIEELPNVKAAFEKLNPRGFEIVGISFDKEKDALVTFVGREGMKWPQYFDDNGGDNEMGQLYGITGIPTMWLVDKQGVLRDLNGRTDLAGKVEKLLDEKE